MKSITINRGDSVEIYDELPEVFEDNDPEFLTPLTEDAKAVLDHVFDFEDYRFVVINGETVAVIYNGEMSGTYTLAKFEELTMMILRNHVSA